MASDLNVYDLQAIEKDVNETASRMHKYWASFILVSVAIFVTTFKISDGEILLGTTSLTIPLIKVDVSLFGYALLTPLVYLVAHTYLLLELIFLNRKISLYEESLHYMVPIDADRRRFRERLHTFPVVRMLTSPGQALGLITGTLAVSTLIFLPFFCFFVLHLRFLAYHSQILTWLTRGIILVDIFVLRLVWLRLANLEFNSKEDGQPRWNIFGHYLVQYYLLVGIIPFVLVGSSYKGETIDGPWSEAIRSVFPFKYLLKDHQNPQFTFFTTYIEPQSDYHVPMDTPPDALRNRDLVSAVLNDLDFSDFNLSNTNLQSASLKKTRFIRADLSRANLRGAHLEGAQLQGAYLGYAHLEGALLGATQLQGANLSNARMQGAKFFRVQLQGASLSGAWMQSTTIERSDFAGALLDGTILNRCTYQ
jgi:hypothetical protein